MSLNHRFPSIIANISCSHAYTETGYLPENFLPSFLDLVVWGHEHECLIEPRYNPEMSFHVMQPGSSVATSLMPGEAVPKHVAILSVTGKEFKTETIRLKSVRPFVMKEIVLQENSHMKKIAMKDDNRPEITRYLIGIVDSLIEEARRGWVEAQDHDIEDEEEVPKPLIRLRVEYTAPEGGRFDCENPQRFSNRFVGKVANVNDVVQFHRKKSSVTRKTKDQPEMPEESVMAQLTLDTVKVEKLVREFLTAQSLTILPQNTFGDAVSQFVDKDDKHAMEVFVNESLSIQMKHLLGNESVEDEDIAEAMGLYKTKMEEMFTTGHFKRTKAGKLKPKPTGWDSDLDGEWADQPGALIRSDLEDNEDEEEPAQPKAKAARGRGKVTGTTRKPAAAAKKAAPAKKPAARGRRKPIEEEEDSDEDVVMIDDDEEEEAIEIDDDEDDEDLFVKPAAKKKAPAKSTAKRTASPPKRKTPARSTAAKPSKTGTGAAAKQTTLSFSQTPAPSQPRAAATRGRKVQESVCVAYLYDRIVSSANEAFRAMMKFPTTTMLSSLHQQQLAPEVESRY